MNTNNLKLGVTIANANRGINSSLIYDELEDELRKKIGSNISITRNDRGEKQGISAASIDVIIEFIIDNPELSEFIIRAIVHKCRELCTKYIKSQQGEIIAIDMNNPDSNLMLDEKYTE